MLCRLESNFRERGADCSNPRWQHLHTNTLLPADEHRGQTSRSLFYRGVLPIHCCCASHVLDESTFYQAERQNNPSRTYQNGDRPLSIFPDERYHRDHVYAYIPIRRSPFFSDRQHFVAVSHIGHRPSIHKERTRFHGVKNDLLLLLLSVQRAGAYPPCARATLRTEAEAEEYGCGAGIA